MGFGFDEGSWIPTAFNMAMMFSGIFVVFFSAWFGPRRILLPAAAIFMASSALLPFAPNYWVMLALVVIAGITSGTFHSLTMTFVLFNLPKRLIIFGIAAYAADIGADSPISALALPLFYGVLDQGERLDWLNSGVIVAMAEADFLQASLGYLLAWAELEQTVGCTPGF